MGRWIWIDRIANIAILVLTIIVGVVAWRHYLTRKPPDVSVPIGSHVDLENVNWPANRLTVVLALSTECHFCSDNAPLYRDIANALRTNRLGKTVAVLPQQVSRSQEYLAAMDVAPDEIRQEGTGPSLAKATPTIVAIGPNGRVLKSWVGRLSQRDATSALREITSLGMQARTSPCPSCGPS